MKKGLSNPFKVAIGPQGAFFFYKVFTKRGIRGKNRAIGEEVLIQGIPMKKLQKYCVANGLIITNKAIYKGDMDHPILFQIGEAMIYRLKEDIENA